MPKVIELGTLTVSRPPVHDGVGVDDGSGSLADRWAFRRGTVLHDVAVEVSGDYEASTHHDIKAEALYLIQN